MYSTQTGAIWSEVDFATRPTQRFHGSIPALVEAINGLIQHDARVLISAPNQGEVDRLASMLQEYHVPYRLVSRSHAPGSATVYSEVEPISPETSALP